MIKQEIIKKYGKKMAENIVRTMKGQTVGVNEDCSYDYYEDDVLRAYNRIVEQVK